MRLKILAVGRLKAGPERELYDRYAERITAAGKSLGLTLALREIAESRAGSPAQRVAEETAALSSEPIDGRLVVLDSAGTAVTSQAFADRIAAWRDQGARETAFMIGGADGLARSSLKGADLVLAFGAMTWPHQIVRIMLVEQLYRAVTILAGHPYHRELR
jgi:23S rRNA (pseudouridine1915-N3)-methyltransferase